MLNIKGALVIMSLGVLVQHSKASIFDGIRDAMSSVEDNLGKLLSDVITDVKETIDCSILAMEKAINFGGVFPVPPGNDKCKRDTELSVIPTDVRDEPHLVEGITNATKQITERIDKSLSIVNKSLYNIIDEGDINIELKSAKNVLVAESDRLFKIDDLLKDDLKSLQAKERDKSRPKGRDINGRALDEVLDVLDIETVIVSKDDDALKLLVKGSETTTELPGARKVTVLAYEAAADKGNQSNIKIKTNNERDKKKSDIQTTVTNPPPVTTFKAIATRNSSPKTTKEVVTTNSTPKTTKEVATTNPSTKTTKEVVTTNSTPKTTKEVATTNPSTKKTKEVVTTNSTPKTTKEVATTNPSAKTTKEVATTNPSTKTAKQVATTNPPPKSFKEVATSIMTQRTPTTASITTMYRDSDYNSFFDMDPLNSASRQQSIEEANNLIESSKYSETIMNKYLEIAKDDAIDIFGDPDLSKMFN